MMFANRRRISGFILLHPLILFSFLLPAFAGSHNTTTDNKQEQPFCFGIVADIQYADMDNRRAETPREVHHRAVLKPLTDFVDSVNNIKPSFVIQLGDLIEGHRHDNRKARHPEEALNDLKTLLGVLGNLKVDLFHVIGNHCLPAGEKALQKYLELERFYYDFTYDAAGGWRFVVLDGNEEGEGLMGHEQEIWLRKVLSEATGKNEKVICFSHYPLIGEIGEEQGLAILDDYGSTVAAWFSGHRHTGRYAFRNGVHHLTLRGMVENPVENAYALIEIHPDKIVVRGYGAEPNRELDLP